VKGIKKITSGVALLMVLCTLISCEESSTLQSLIKLGKLTEPLPSPFEQHCMALMEQQEAILEAIQETTIAGHQQVQLTTIFRTCEQSIEQEIQLTHQEFPNLAPSSDCLVTLDEMSNGFGELAPLIETFSNAPLGTAKENNAAKVMATMLPLSIVLVGAKVSANRMAICTLEQVGFNQ